MSLKRKKEFHWRLRGLSSLEGEPGSPCRASVGQRGCSPTGSAQADPAQQQSGAHGRCCSQPLLRGESGVEQDRSEPSPARHGRAKAKSNPEGKLRGVTERLEVEEGGKGGKSNEAANTGTESCTRSVAANIIFIFHYQECHELKNALKAA